LAGAEKTGGMTPRIARVLLEDILGIELPEFSDKVDPDVPFSLIMAEAVKNKADTTEPGQQVTAIKSTGDPLIDHLLSIHKEIDGDWKKFIDEDEDSGENHDHEDED